MDTECKRQNDKQKDTEKKQRILRGVTGILAGAANGIFGGGGGVFLVPLMTYMLRYDNKRSHATAPLVILPLTVVSAVTYVLRGVYDVALSWKVGLGVVAGGVVGALLLKKISAKWLSYVFYSLLVLSGGYLLAKTLWIDA